MANITKPFEPYYDRVLGQTITSQRQKERLVRAHRSKSHPEGIYDVRDDHKFMKEQMAIQRDREGYKASTMPGYKPKSERELEEIKRRGGERAFDRNNPTGSGTKYFHR